MAWKKKITANHSTSGPFILKVWTQLHWIFLALSTDAEAVPEAVFLFCFVLFYERDANWSICWFRLSKHRADNSTKNTQRHWKTLANTKQNTFRPSIINKFWHGQPASDDRRTLSRHHSTAPIIVLILLALQLPSGRFFFLYLLFTVGFYSPRLRKELAVAQLDLQSRMKSSSGGERKKEKQELVGNLKSLPYNYNKNTWIWVVSAARESAGVSIVMVNSQRGAVCATQRGSPPQWTGPGVKWEIKSPETCSPSKQLLSGWESARSRQPAAD